MNPKFRLWLFIIAGTVLGVWIGIDVANEKYGIATILALVSVSFAIARASDVAPDAWMLGASLIGYIVGNRGFAQMQPSRQIPLLPAEAVLLVAIPALILRMVTQRATGIRRDALNHAILVWMLISTIRLPLDLSRFGVIALRDYATVYYGAFFFVAQAFCAHAATAEFLKRALTVAFVVLVPVVITIQLWPNFLVDHLTWSGIPIIFHKSDLIATALAAGFMWLWTRIGKSGNRFWIVPAAASLLLIGLMASPRAAMAAVAVTTVLWLIVGRWRIAVSIAGITVAASVLTLVGAAVLGKDLRTTAAYSAFEHAVSIFDPTGSGTYINGESGDPGDNNRFRIIWWRDVVAETLQENPALGLGFGSDLASRFLADYDLLADESFTARSPHSMIVTMLGRTGIIGLLAWIAVSAGLARMVWRLFRKGDPDGMGLASIVCVYWISACVGVVLESPMAAIVFWTVAGLANGAATKRDPEANDPVSP